MCSSPPRRVLVSAKCGVLRMFIHGYHAPIVSFINLLISFPTQHAIPLPPRALPHHHHHHHHHNHYRGSTCSAAPPYGVWLGPTSARSWMGARYRGVGEEVQGQKYPGAWVGISRRTGGYYGYRTAPGECRFASDEFEESEGDEILVKERS